MTANPEELLHPVEDAKLTCLLKFDQANQFQKLEHLRDAAYSHKANEVDGLAVVLNERIERYNRDQIDPKPGLQVIFGNLATVLYKVQVLIDIGRVENNNHIHEKQAVNDPVHHCCRLPQVVKQGKLHRRRNAGVKQQNRHENVPVKFEGVLKRDYALLILPGYIDNCTF